MILFLVLADPVYILDELGIQKNSFVGPYRQDFHYTMQMLIHTSQFALVSIDNSSQNLI